MPQELALHTEFSISETFSYFGRLHGLGGDEVARQAEFLTQLLDLPNGRSQIKTLR